MIRVGAGGDRLQQRRQHRLERLLRGRRAQRPRLARAPVGDVARGRFGVGEAELAQARASRMSGIVRQLPVARRARGCRRSRRRARRAAASRSSSSAPSPSPCSCATLSSAAGSRGKQVRLRVVDHLHAMLDRAQQPVGSASSLGASAASSRPPRRSAVDRVERRRRAHRRIAAAVDHLLDLDEELDLADSAAAALQVVAGAECLRLARNGRGSARRSARTSSITPKSSERRQTNGWIASRKRSPERDVAGAGAGADEGRALPRQRAEIHNARWPR